MNLKWELYVALNVLHELKARIIISLKTLIMNLRSLKNITTSYHELKIKIIQVLISLGLCLNWLKFAFNKHLENIFKTIKLIQGDPRFKRN